jgi:glycerate 2-kinase
MHILIAPNAFKHSLSASAAADAILQGLRQSRLTFTGECFPIGDGGDGTGDLLIQRLGAQRIQTKARDPLGRMRTAYFGLTTDNNIAIIEMANASGLRLLDEKERDPLVASSAGTGDLIRAALDKKASHILIGLGGSATVDGGAGILSALGIRFLDKQGHDLPPTPVGFINLDSIDTTDLDPRLAGTKLTVLCDVGNRLLGPEGAAAVFGPQKGATADIVEVLETSLQHLTAITRRQLGTDLSAIPSGGAAGGAAAGLNAFLRAGLIDGIDYFLTITDFETALDRSHLVITGEGSIDEQTLHGKAPFGVASRAKKKGLPVIGLAGRIPKVTHSGLDRYFDALLPINPQPLTLAEALANSAANLTITARALGNLLCLSRHQ